VGGEKSEQETHTQVGSPRVRETGPKKEPPAQIIFSTVSERPLASLKFQVSSSKFQKQGSGRLEEPPEEPRYNGSTALLVAAVPSRDPEPLHELNSTLRPHYHMTKLGRDNLNMHVLYLAVVISRTKVRVIC
jgi:hypothetical protein